MTAQTLRELVEKAKDSDNDLSCPFQEFIADHGDDFIRLIEAAEYCQRQAESQRVWGGTEWKYPFPWKRVFDSTTEALAPFKEKS